MDFEPGCPEKLETRFQRGFQESGALSGDVEGADTKGPAVVGVYVRVPTVPTRKAQGFVGKKRSSQS